MTYRKYGCCCDDACLQAWFSEGGKVDISKWKLTGESANWQSLNSPTRVELNDGTTSTPAASARRRITAAMRNGSQNFTIEARVQSIFSGSFVSKQTGIFVADAFALWVNWSDRTLRFGTTDSVGTLGPGTVLYTYPALPYNAVIRAKLFWNANGKWNVEIWAPWGGGLYEQAPRVVLYDQVFSGIGSTGPFEWGLTSGTGGSGWKDVLVSCGAYSCPGCSDATPLTFSKTNSAISGTISDPTEFKFWGTCNYIAAGLLDPSIMQVMTGVGPKDLFKLHPTDPASITWWLMMNYSSGVEDDNYYIVAEVNWHYVGPLSDGQQPIGVALWKIPRNEWCCYGSNTWTLIPSTDPTYGGFGYDLGTGEPTAIRGVYLQSLAGWPATITTQAPGPDPATPCTVDCLWTAVKSGTSLAWSKPNGLPVCPAGTSCSEPVFLPSREGQQAYTVCE